MREMSVRPEHERYPRPFGVAAIPPSLPIADYPRTAGPFKSVRHSDVHCSSDKAKMELAADAGAGVEDSAVDTTSTPAMSRLVGVMFGDEMHVGTANRFTQSVARLVSRGMRDYERYSKSAPIEAREFSSSESGDGAVVFHMRMSMWPPATAGAPAGFKHSVTAKRAGSGLEVPVSPVTAGNWARLE